MRAELIVAGCGRFRSPRSENSEHDTAHGVVIILNDRNKEITVESQGGISLRAQTEISLQADGGISIECSGVVDVQGSLINLN